MARRLALVVAAAAILTACGTSLPAQTENGGPVRVVAAENFWGSIVAQVGGTHAHVTSIVANPGTDPHDYEPTPGDARSIATAQYVVANGAGYDPWVQQLVAANPVSGRKALVVADALGLKSGDNPHVWYSPDYVLRIVDRLAADLGSLDPGDATYFRGQAQLFKIDALTPYLQAIGAIKQKYSGTKVGATESLFSYVASATDLDLITPYSYLKAISEGQEPSAADKAEVEREIATREIRVFLFNTQNSTPDVQGLVAQAKAAGIPVVEMTETLTPQNATFQDWQTRQLEALLHALGG